MEEFVSKMKQAAKSIGMSLYKYYNKDEERDPEVPDILDALYDQYDAIATGYRSFSANDWRIRTGILIDKISEERSEFYVVEHYSSSPDHIVTAQPVSFKEYVVRSPILVGDKIEWRNIGKVVDVPGFTKIQINKSDAKDIGHTEGYFILHVDKNDTHYYSYLNDFQTFTFTSNLIPGDKYIGFESFDNYLQFRENMGDPIVFRKCIVCNEIFNISPGEASWLKYKKFDLPKRCLKHRDKKMRKNAYMV